MEAHPYFFFSCEEDLDLRAQQKQKLDQKPINYSGKAISFTCWTAGLFSVQSVLGLHFSYSPSTGLSPPTADTHTHTRADTHTHTHTRRHTHTHTRADTNTHTHTRTHTHTHTHRHADTHTRRHKHTHTH